MKKCVLGIILTALLALSGVFNSNTMALDSDYKNNLLKVDVKKASDGSYKLELFTQKPYNEPIKVIKKSETSYYVLLPETYHSITSVAPAGDVSRVDVKLYPYAGQDLNNGYTKINISTSKPVTFSANVKTAGGTKPQVDTKKLAQLDKAFENKTTAPVKIASANTQKPANTQVSSQQNRNVTGATPQVKQNTTVKSPAATASKANDEPKKLASAGVGGVGVIARQNNAAKNNQTVQKPAPAAQNVVKKPETAQNTQNKASQAPKTSAPEAQAGTATEIEIAVKPKVQEPVKQQEILEPKDTIPQSLEEVLDAEETEDELMMDEDAREQGLTELATGEDEVIPELTQKERIKNYARAFVKMLLENILVVIAIILFAIAIVLMSRGLRTKQQAESSPSTEPAFEPINSWKEPDTLPVDVAEKAAGSVDYSAYEGGSIDTPAPVSLGEAASVGVADNVANEEVYEPKPMQTYEEAQSAAAVESEPEDEASVLAQEAFGEGRGLCLVNYDGSIALVGYIGEEIFVIQNFGKITLINPNIQLRIAEQNDNDTIYIVKTANSKLMVRETKDLIGLEMVM